MKEISLNNTDNPNVKLIIWVLLFLVPIIGMGVDLIAPSLPVIAKSLHIRDSFTQNLISSYVMGAAVGGFITGFLSDAWGRQKLLRFNLAVFVVVSILPALFPNIILLLLVRFLQGVTVCAGSVLVRATFADILSYEELIKIGATYGIMWGIGPVIGPILGSYLQVYFGWKSCFYFFAIAAFIELVLIYFTVPETHTKRHKLEIKIIKNNIQEVLSNTKFIGLVLLMGLMYSLLTSFHTLCPFLVQNILGYSTLFFGKIALGLGALYLGSSMLCRFLIQKFPVEKLFFIMINGFAILATINLALVYFYPKNLFLIILASAMMFGFCATVYPLAMGKATALFKHIAGSASAIMFTNVIVGSAVSFSSSLINLNSAIPLLFIFFLLSTFAALVYWKLIK